MSHLPVSVLYFKDKLDLQTLLYNTKEFKQLCYEVAYTWSGRST